jgi:hypothetical protein
MPAPTKLSSLFAKSRKLFEPAGRQCEFCAKRGHDVSFCPLKQTVPSDEDKCKFADALIAGSMLDAKKAYAELGLEGAVEAFLSRGAQLNAGNPRAGSSSVRDALSSRLGYWAALGAGRSVLSWVAYGLPLRMVCEPHHWQFPNHPSSFEFADFVRAEVQEQVDSGRFIIVDKSFVKVCNPQQVERSASGKLRRCDDLRFINAHVAHIDFRLETLHQTTPDVVQPGDRLFKADLAKAYYRVNMERRAWGYLCFFDKESGRYIASTVLVFGYSQGPMYFSKLLRPVAAFFRVLGVRVIVYIDDSMWSESPDKVMRLVGLVRRVFDALGWEFNSKSEWVPAESVTFLGLVVDAERYEIRASPESLARAKALIGVLREKAEAGQPLLVRDLRVLTGKVICLSLANPALRVWTRELYAVIGAAPVQMFVRQLPVEALEELKALPGILDRCNGNPIRDRRFDLSVASDASDFGWGGLMLPDGKSVDGMLPDALFGTSSTLREMEAVRFVMCALESELRGKRVRFVLDSTAAVANFTKGGGPVVELSRSAKLFLNVATSLGVTAVFEWVPRAKNAKADLLSKRMVTDWVVREEVMLSLCQRWSVPPLSVLMPDFNAVAAVARMVSPKLGRVVMVCPAWPSQAWWPLLNSLARDSLQLGPMLSCLRPRAPIQQHAITPPWSMVAFLLA